jgi:hypothetical protein|tara:strand:- start:331 stop:651 length:321 start_codon:yes stop_codon:yes gene_type:complete
MEEIDEMENDQRMLRSAMENTYKILTGKATWENLMEKVGRSKGIDQNPDVALLFNPMDENYNPKFPHLHNDVNSDELIESMVDYYIESEEYEKCAELIKYKERTNG